MPRDRPFSWTRFALAVQEPVVPIREATIEEWLKWDREYRASEGRPWPGDDRMTMSAIMHGYNWFYEIATD